MLVKCLQRLRSNQTILQLVTLAFFLFLLAEVETPPIIAISTTIHLSYFPLP